MAGTSASRPAMGESIPAASSHAAHLVCIRLLGEHIDFPLQRRMRGLGNSIPVIQGMAIIIVIIPVFWTDRFPGTQNTLSLILHPRPPEGREEEVGGCISFSPFHQMEKKQSPSLETESRQCPRVESWTLEPWGLGHCPLLLEAQKQS